MSDPKFQTALIVDVKDDSNGQRDIFYIHPKRISMLRCVEAGAFNGAFISNTSVDILTSLNLVYILRCLNPNDLLKIVVHQPISVMQEYDAKQILANLKLAGVHEIEIEDFTIQIESRNKEYNTKLITCKKSKNLEIDRSISAKIEFVKREEVYVKGKQIQMPKENKKIEKKNIRNFN